jgi:F0F1-type ATP synthase epsilon subunit
MTLGVYSLEKILFRGPAVELNCPSENGEITILDHHEPLISFLKNGVIKVIDDEKKEHYIPIRSGFVEVRSGGEVKCLIEEAT